MQHTVTIVHSHNTQYTWWLLFSHRIHDTVCDNCLFTQHAAGCDYRQFTQLMTHFLRTIKISAVQVHASSSSLLSLSLLYRSFLSSSSSNHTSISSMGSSSGSSSNIIIIIMIGKIITLTGTIWDFYNLLTVLGTVSNTHAQVAMGQSCWKSRAAHRVLITCNMSCAIWYEGAAQLLSLTEFKSHLF